MSLSYTGMPKQSEELDSKVQKDIKQYDNNQHNQNGHADSSKHFSLMDNLSHKCKIILQHLK